MVYQLAVDPLDSHRSSPLRADGGIDFKEFLIGFGSWVGFFSEDEEEAEDSDTAPDN